jgi:hypothetical protein
MPYKVDYFKAFGIKPIKYSEGSLYKVRSNFPALQINEQPIYVQRGDYLVYLGLEAIYTDPGSDVVEFYRSKFLFKEQVIVTSSAIIQGRQYLEPVNEVD